MVNAFYQPWAEQLLQGGANTSLGGNVKAVLVDLADYTFSSAHDFLDDVPVGARVATSGNLATKTFTNGVFDAADVTFTSVTGDQSEAIILYVDSGAAATSRLICFLDTVAAGLPVTPNGGDITVTWNASGIFDLV